MKRIGRKSQHLLMILAALLLLLAGCGRAESGGDNQQGGGNKQDGEIYFLNFKPEIAEIYNQIAKDYEQETGVRVKVVTAASGTYETTLRSEIAKNDAPTIFQINGPIGYQTWKDYTRDLKDTELYANLTDQGLAVTDGDGVYGIPYVVEGYGIIYNNAIMEQYFALPNRATEFTSMDEVNNFAALKALVEDMTAHKDELGIKGVFASTSLAAGEQWRWQTHLANIPFYYEFLEDTQEGDSPTLTALAADEIEFRYDQNFKNIFDLYLTTPSPKARSSAANRRPIPWRVRPWTSGHGTERKLGLGTDQRRRGERCEGGRYTLPAHLRGNRQRGKPRAGDRYGKLFCH